MPRALLELLKADIKPRDIMTRKACENAMVLSMALGGSTNAVLHLIAMAKAVDVELTLEDFQACSDRTPFIADLKPSGKFVMEDLHLVRDQSAGAGAWQRSARHHLCLRSRLCLQSPSDGKLH